MRTRTTVLQAHTHQWLGTFSGVSGAGNGDYRGELRQVMKAIRAYLQAQSLQPAQAVIRLDGQYGNGAIVADLAGLAYVMRGKDSDLLDLPEVQARAGPAAGSSLRPILRREPAGRSLTSPICCFRQLDRARESLSPHVRR